MKIDLKLIVTVIAVYFIVGCSTSTPNIKYEKTYSDFNPTDQWKEALIADILKKTPELNIHRMNGQIDNQVFVHEDGHREAVFDAQGKIVTDPVNEASYNYYDRKKEPMAHFAKDTHPWLKWGNTHNDPSTKKQRLNAYLKDLKIGINSAFNDRNIKVNQSTIVYQSKTGKDVVLLFLKIIRESDDDSLFQMYEDPYKFSENRLDQFLNAIEPVFINNI